MRDFNEALPKDLTASELDEYICTHYGEHPADHLGAVVPPIYQSSLHVYPDYQAFVDAQKDEQKHYLYWRGTNPTVEIVEKKLAALERGESCKCFASGMAAIAAAVLSCLKSGDHIITLGNVYGTSLKLVQYLVKKWQVEHTAIYQPSIEQLEKCIQPNTAVILCESPTTMTFQLLKINELVKLARHHGIKTIIDNTWSTPLFQKPLEMGIDIVVHSAAKYLSGHSDILAGAIIADQLTIKHIFEQEYTLFGGALPPYEAWLLIRGLRTLPLRMKQHHESGLKVARFLEAHPQVKRVNHPGLESHPQYNLAKEQLQGYSSVFSFELVEPSFEKVKQVINALSMFQIGFSFGSYESLVLAENQGDNLAELEEKGIDPGLIRISVGLENVSMLIKDLEQALAI